MGYAIPRGVPAGKALGEQCDRFREILGPYANSPELAELPGAIPADKVSRELKLLEEYLSNNEELLAASKEPD